MRTPEALEAAHLLDRLERLTRSGEQVAGTNPAQWDALRYLARANRFSRTPAALADYLASTRGTVSQTLIALERKGFVTRAQNRTDKRRIELSLTARGMATLKADPLLARARDIDAATGPRLYDLVTSLRALLKHTIVRNDGRAFGVCRTCRHFRGDVRPGAASPHHCALLDEPLSEADSDSICVEQESQAA